MLDVFELCTAELQEKMVSVRSKFKKVEDKKLEMQQQPKASALWYHTERVTHLEKPPPVK